MEEDVQRTRLLIQQVRGFLTGELLPAPRECSGFSVSLMPTSSSLVSCLLPTVPAALSPFLQLPPPCSWMNMDSFLDLCPSHLCVCFSFLCSPDIFEPARPVLTAGSFTDPRRPGMNQLQGYSFECQLLRKASCRLPVCAPPPISCSSSTQEWWYILSVPLGKRGWLSVLLLMASLAHI